MKLDNGEVFVSPKVIYWTEMPNTIGEEEYLELFKNDILLVKESSDYDNLEQLKNKFTKYSAFVFNLDKIIQSRAIKGIDATSAVNNILQFIIDFAPYKSLVHTTVIDEKIANTVKSFGVPYVEKNLNDRITAVTFLNKIVFPFFSEQGKIIRSSVRQHLYPCKIKVQLIRTADKSYTIDAVLKDLSLNGMGLVIPETYDMGLFELKDLVKLKVFMRPSHFNVTMAAVTRINKKKSEIGLKFDIHDHKMMQPVDADILSKSMYRWMKEIIRTYGKIECNSCKK